MTPGQRRYQTGASLIVGLVLLLVVTLVVFAGVRGTQMQERMTSNLNNKAISYMAAEAGASTFADWVFGEVDSNGWPDGNADHPTTGDVGNGQGRFAIEDVTWDDPPGRVSFVSIGESVIDGFVLAESRLTVEIEGPMGGGIPPPEAAYQCFGEYCTTATGSNSNSAIYYDGREWDPPVSESCTGSGCDGTLTGNSGVPGIYLVGNMESGAISTGNQGGDSRPGQIMGDPESRRQTDKTTEIEINGETKTTFESTGGTTVFDWNNTIDEVLQRSRGNNSLVELDATQVTEVPAEDLGSRSNPTVLHITAPSDGGFVYEDIRVTGNTHGAGVMIIDGDIDFSTAAGTSTFEGLIILRNGAKLTGGRGTFNVFGSIISLEGQRYADDAQNVEEDIIDADLGGNFTLKHSKSALENVGGLFGGEVTILTWVEQVGS